MEQRLEEALALLRIQHLHSLYSHLGQTELKAVVWRMLAPAATIGWQVSQNYAAVAQNVAKLVGGMTGK